jgi:hypothetical protein
MRREWMSGFRMERDGGNELSLQFVRTLARRGDFGLRSRTCGIPLLSGDSSDAAGQVPPRKSADKSAQSKTDR